MNDDHTEDGDGTDIEPLQRLSRDLRRAATLLSPREVRYLVADYYQLQDSRIRAMNQLRKLKEFGEPHDLLKWVGTNAQMLEGQVKGALLVYAKGDFMGRWALSIVGVGPIIAAGLRAHINLEPWHCMKAQASMKVKPCKPDTPCTPRCYLERIETYGHINRFAGLDPTSQWETGEKRPWNAALKVLCVRRGSYVTTRRGPVPIEEVVVGDDVLTHLSRWRPVTEVFANEYRGDLIGLRSANAGNQLVWLTPGHPVHAASVQTWQSARTFKANEATREPFAWHPVEAVEPRWKVQRPRIQTEQGQVMTLCLEGVAVEDGRVAAAGRWDGVKAPRAVSVPRTIEVDARVSRVLGLFVAEGHISHGHIGWSFHERETDLVRDVQSVMRDRFGVEAALQRQQANRCVQVIIGSLPIATMLADTCGRGSTSMRVPQGIFSASYEVRQAFWDGVMAGDGDHVGRMAGRRISMKNSVLARQLVDLGRQLGLSVSLHQEPQTGACRIHVNQRDDGEPSVLASLLMSYDGTVYNLEVEEDCSYVVEGYAVHNCWKIGESFVKTHNLDGDVYGHLYEQRKASEVTKNTRGDFSDQAADKLRRFKIGKGTDAWPWYAGVYTSAESAAWWALDPKVRPTRPGFIQRMWKMSEPISGVPMLPPGHIHARAKRVAVKAFLSDWFMVAYRHQFGKMAPKPYPLAHQGHVHQRSVPNWPF